MMQMARNKSILSKLTLICLILGKMSVAEAAEKYQSHQYSPSALLTSTHLHELSRMMGPKQKLHVRVQQEYMGYPVWGGDAVWHIANAHALKKAPLSMLSQKKVTLSGNLYQSLDQDLRDNPAAIFTAEQAAKAKQAMLVAYEQKIGKKVEASQQQAEAMVYVDKDNRAHFAYKVSFFVEPIAEGLTPTLPTYLVDAKTLQIFEEWNDLHTATVDKVLAGGYGGNTKTGQFTYDGSTGNLPALNITRDAATQTCYLENDIARVKRRRMSGLGNIVVMSYPCATRDPKHNNVYWNDLYDQTGTAYSPANDVLYISDVVHDMFQDWYHAPVIAINGEPRAITFVLHYTMSNAIYAGGVLSVGDGLSGTFHPFSTRDIITHEMSHGFTDQYSKLVYSGQSGGINESFSDLTAKALQFYLTGTNDWNFAADVMVQKGDLALRYMDRPSKDCEGRSRRLRCSVDSMQEYKAGMDPHQSAAIFNQVFYLWATSPGWDTRRVHHVAVTANMHYWTSKSTFSEAACGMLSAAQDLGYSTAAPISAFQKVGVDITSCTL